MLNTLKGDNPTPRSLTLSPSILSADFAKLGEQLTALYGAGVRNIHVDVMDGQFVRNISMGIPVLASLTKFTKDKGLDIFFDVHLMIESPDKYLEPFVKAGAGGITIHLEASDYVNDVLRQVRGLGVQCGLAIRPHTPLELLYPYLETIDMALIMSVNPGFGGQDFIPNSIPRAAQLYRHISELGLNVAIQMDGGIEMDNIADVISAGVCNLVVGSALFDNEDLGKEAKFFIDKLHKVC